MTTRNHQVNDTLARAKAMEARKLESMEGTIKVGDGACVCVRRVGVCV